MRWLARILLRLVVLVAALVAITIATLSEGDPSIYPGQGPRIHVIDHGFHSEIVLRASDVRFAAFELAPEDPAAASRLRWLAGQYPEALWIEVGWGDAAFYQVTPGFWDIDPMLGLRAILWPTASVLQVVPVYAEPEQAFAFSSIQTLDLSDAGFKRLASQLAKSIPDTPKEPLGPSLYGQGAFYPSLLDYHLFRTCNHWVSSLLRAAGVPSSPIPGTFSLALMSELRWRAN